MEKMEFIAKDDPNFPSLLREAPKCPTGIYIKGNKSILNDSCLKIAIVGTRKATPSGLVIARELARTLAKQGIVIVSGLAIGVDQAAHWGCLEGNGKTIAVLAHGLDSVHPSQHYNLAKKILDNGGALVSEYPAGTPVLPYRFLERNRIVSGLSKGVAVVEAPKRSGALSTAAYALEQNREIFVIPGAVNNSNYIGSNDLIKQGASLTTGAGDILDVFDIINNNSRQQAELSFNNLNKDQKLVLDTLNSIDESFSIDKLCQITKLTPQKANQVLTSLVIEEYIRENSGRYVIL